LFCETEIRCPEPVLANHRILTVTNNDRQYGRTLIRTGDPSTSGAGLTYKIGALAKYQCERGYKVVGETLSTCEDTGTWSGEVPQCICKFSSLNFIFPFDKALKLPLSSIRRKPLSKRHSALNDESQRVDKYYLSPFND